MRALIFCAFHVFFSVVVCNDVCLGIVLPIVLSGGSYYWVLGGIFDFCVGIIFCACVKSE